MNFAHIPTTQVFGDLPTSPHTIMPLPILNAAGQSSFEDLPHTDSYPQLGPLGTTPFESLSAKAQLKQLRAELEVWIQQGSASEYRRLASDRIYQNLHQHLHPHQPHLDSTRLSLSSLQLKTLPECLGRLTHLRNLNLSTNIGLKLPDCMLQLGQLEELNLSGTLCGNLPACVSKLTSLKTLNLSACMLEQLPSELGKLRHLEGLDLSSNRLDSLPSTLEQMSALTHLNLGHNRFETLPICITALTKLEHLDFAFNKLAKLPDNIENLTKLQKLNLNRNFLGSLPPPNRTIAGAYYIDSKLQLHHRPARGARPAARAQKPKPTVQPADLPARQHRAAD